MLSVVAARAVARDVDVAVEVDIDFFYQELAPHGTWIESSVYGTVWTPRGVAAGWQPYTDGHWEFTEDHGWLWVSDWEWGWAPFHYGRWAFDEFNGWIWVPGTEWGPAWVAWREGNGHVGWAPLPPEVEWNVSVGLQMGGLDLAVQIEPRYWTFVQERHILEPHVHLHCVQPVHRVTLLKGTRNVTRYVTVEGRIVNRSLSVERVERIVGRSVPRRKVRILDGAVTQRRVEVRGGEISLYRPRVVRRASHHSGGKVLIHQHKAPGRIVDPKAPGPAPGSSPSIVRVRQKTAPSGVQEGHSESQPKATTTRKVKRRATSDDPDQGNENDEDSSKTGERKVVRKKKP